MLCTQTARLSERCGQKAKQTEKKRCGRCVPRSWPCLMRDGTATRLQGDAAGTYTLYASHADPVCVSVSRVASVGRPMSIQPKGDSKASGSRRRIALTPQQGCKSEKARPEARRKVPARLQAPPSCKVPHFVISFYPQSCHSYLQSKTERSSPTPVLLSDEPTPAKSKNSRLSFPGRLPWSCLACLHPCRVFSNKEKERKGYLSPRKKGLLVTKFHKRIPSSLLSSDWFQAHATPHLTNLSCLFCRLAILMRSRASS
jgi:hypothetical protein